MKHRDVKVVKYALLFSGIISLFFGGMFVITKNTLPPYKPIETNHARTAIFSMGCFLSSEPAFVNLNTNEKFPGILSIRVGYVKDKNHEDYKKSVKIRFNPSIISYRQLLDIFWHNIDPFNKQGQFCNKESAYTAAIFYSDDVQKEEALDSKKRVEAFLQKKVVTPILKVEYFHEAEEKYQNFFNKNPIRYSYYQWKCKRDKPLKEIWGDISYMYQ